MTNKLVLLMSVAALSGCSIIPGLRISEPRLTEPEGYRLVTLTPEVVRALRTGTLTESPRGGADSLPVPQISEYVVGPGDVLTVVVWGHPELTNPTGEFRDPVSAGRLVASDGRMYFPHVGEFIAAGKRVSEIRDVIADGLTRVIQKPQVDVRVAAYRSQRVQVTGEVSQPGQVLLDDTPKGVLEAINERGGLNPTGSRRQAILVRVGQSYRIDLAALHSGVRPARNPALRPGDVVHVPGNTEDQVFVLGEVETPAPVVIRNDFMSLTEALTSTGGLSRLSANDSGVLVFRRAPDDAAQQIPTVFRLDLSEPQGLLLAGEFELLPRDVVYVKATAFAQYNLIINQLLPTISTIFQIDRLTE